MRRWVFQARQEEEKRRRSYRKWRIIEDRGKVGSKMNRSLWSGEIESSRDFISVEESGIEVYLSNIGM